VVLDMKEPDVTTSSVYIGGLNALHVPPFVVSYRCRVKKNQKKIKKLLKINYYYDRVIKN